MFPAHENVQVLARSILAIFLGTILVVFAQSPLVTVASGVALMLIADSAVGLALYSRGARAGLADDPWSTWLRPLWGFNLGINLMMLLALQHRPLVAVVIAVTTAITTGVWLITLLQSEARLQGALLLWAALLFVSATALPVVWTLQLTPLDAWSPRLLGIIKVLLGLLMMLALKRSEAPA